MTAAIRWGEQDLRDYQARRVQLPLGRADGLNKAKRINGCELEWQEATRLIRWVDGEGAKLCAELARLYAVPNGGYRHKAIAGKLRAQGVRPGVPDFALDVARHGYHGLRGELKRRVGGSVSPAQRDWIAWLTEQGYLAEVWRGWEAARDRLVWYVEEGA